MDTTLPRPDHVSADLALLLRESHRDDPILPELHDAGQAPEDELDGQILAGLVHPC